MARIRSIKPEFFSSASVARCEPCARLLFIGTWNFADDEGRLLNIPRQIYGNVFPHDKNISESDVEKWLDQLEFEGCIARYETDGISVLSIVEWKKHQKISNPGKSHLPGIPEDYQRPSRDSAETRHPDLGPRIIGPRISGDPESDVETLESSSAVDNSGASDDAQERDQIRVSLLLALRFDSDRMTPNERSLINTAANQLYNAQATPAEIHDRALVYRGRWPDMTLTAMALVKHWSSLVEIPKTDPAEHLESLKRYAAQYAFLDVDEFISTVESHFDNPDDRVVVLTTRSQMQHNPIDTTLIEDGDVAAMDCTTGRAVGGDL